MKTTLKQKKSHNQMKQPSYIKNLVWYSITGFILFLVITFLSQNCCIWEDDEHYSILTDMNGLFSTLSFNSEHGGGYIGLLLTKFFSFYLPVQMDIHPIDFISSPVWAFIKTLFIVCVLFGLTRFVNFFHKSSQNILFFVFLCFYFIFSVFYTNSFILVLNYQFFRYFFSIIFFAYFVYFIFKHLLSENITPPPKPSPGGRAGWGNCQTFNLILAMISGYITGTSSEILIGTTGVLYVAPIVYNLLCKVFKNLKPFNIDKFYHIAFIPYFIAILLFMSSPGFGAVSNMRGINNIHITFGELLFYSKLYFIVLFKHEFLYWIICAALIFGLFKIKADKRNMILPCVFQIIVLLMYFALIACGETGGPHSELTIDGIYSLYYITHRQLRFLFEMIMLIPLFMYYSLFISSLKENGRKSAEIIVPVVLIILSLITFIGARVLYSDYIGNKYLKEIKKDVYKMEKVFRYQVIKGQSPVLLTMGIPRPTHWFTINPNDLIFYYRNIYKPSGEHPYTFFPGDTGEKYFFENGGIITEDELNNIKFSRLKNDNFILYNKEGE